MSDDKRTDTVRGKWKKAPEPLTAPEHALLAQLEAVIERGQRTFVEVGLALLKIRDGRLYRKSHKTFEAYCQERWNWGRNYANKQIAAAEVASRLGTVVPNGRVARELAPLRHMPEQEQAAWQRAVEEHGPEPTAAQVRWTVRAFLAAPDPVDRTGIRPDGGAATAEVAEQLRELRETLEQIPREGIRQIRQMLAWCDELKSYWGEPTLPLHTRRCAIEHVDGWTRGLKQSGEIIGLTGPDNKPIGRLRAIQGSPAAGQLGCPHLAQAVEESAAAQDDLEGADCGAPSEAGA